MTLAVKVALKPNIYNQLNQLVEAKPLVAQLVAHWLVMQLLQTRVQSLYDILGLID